MSDHVLIFGTFDLLHPGHTFVIREAIARGRVTVVLARDQTVKRLKGALPVHSESERMQRIVDVFPGIHVVLGSTVDFLEPVRYLKPSRILLGYDQQLPPGIHEVHLPCPIERLPSFRPEIYKSSIERRKMAC